MIWMKTELKGISGMQFPLKFEFASDKLPPLSSLRKKICLWQTLLWGHPLAARLFCKGTQLKDIHATIAAAAVLKSPGWIK